MYMYTSGLQTYRETCQHNKITYKSCLLQTEARTSSAVTSPGKSPMMSFRPAGRPSSHQCGSPKRATAIALVLPHMFGPWGCVS